MDWNNQEYYKKFISYLQGTNLNLKKFPFCVSDAESLNEMERAKAQFDELLSESGDPNASAFTVKLSDSALETIRNFKI